MRTENQSDVEPSVFTSVSNHRRLILICIGVVAVLAVVVASLRPSKYVAEAGVLLEEPSPTAITNPAAGDEVRYVADQVAILKSVAVSERASALAAEGEDPEVIAPRDLRRNASITSSEGSNFIVIRFRARNPKTAEAGANAIVRAYRELIQADLNADTKAAISRLDAAILAVTRTLPTAGPDAEALLAELRARKNRVQVDAQLQGDGVALFSPAELGKSQGISLVSVLAIAIVLGGLIGTGLAYLLDARKQAFSSRTEPQALLDAPALGEIPDFAREGINSKLPVIDAPGTESAESFRFLAAAIGLPRESSNGSVASKLGESWQEEFAGLNDRELAVLDLVASGLDQLVLQAQKAAGGRDRDGGSATHRTIAFVSGSFGDGTTTLAANTALAAAQEGNRVLAIDADVGHRDLTRLLVSDSVWSSDGPYVPSAGLTDMLLHGTAVEIRPVTETRAGGSLSLLEPGTATVDEMRIFRADQTQAALDSTHVQFDRVIIDVPPILHVAYADALVRSAGAVVVIVPHRSESARLKHVLDRLALLGVHPIGYVYNFAPPRTEVRERRASSRRHRYRSTRATLRGRPTAQDVLERAEKRVVDLARTISKKPPVR